LIAISSLHLTTTPLILRSANNSYSSSETALAASLKRLILHSERLFDLSIRGVVVKCSDEIAIKVFPDSRDCTEYHNLILRSNNLSECKMSLFNDAASAVSEEE
jgi:hypothetical protein